MAGKGIRFALGVCPINIVSHFMIDGVDPAPLGVVLASALPMLRMHQMDHAVFVGFARRLPPIEILIPLHAWAFQSIKPAHE